MQQHLPPRHLAFFGGAPMFFYMLHLYVLKMYIGFKCRITNPMSEIHPPWQLSTLPSRPFPLPGNSR
ncbi:hypothetical protein NSMM_370002 [Nitrosomonas mobilis]|uniref:Uncharacterized protein n=1 Tax=Nitrosomonas mobilis TaxID=51642 RepID=A0A1G5SDF2_9PROT|nr:hypothetical protein NSMM_370002 [Nitrosomonas mobilis]